MSISTGTRSSLGHGSVAAKKETVSGHLIGLMLFVASCAMVIAGIVERLDGGDEANSLLGPGLIVGVPSLLLWRRTTSPLRAGAATIFSSILAGWLAFTVFAALPYLLSGVVDRFDLALFESVSGFTTTASTVLRGLDDVPRGILLWRATTQWFGGVAITVFVVSVLPYYRTAGFEHLAGISHSYGAQRMGSRIEEMAKRIVLVYVAFTLIVAAAYAGFGMGPFDAIAHAFSTVSTGGFSTHDRSLAFFDSAGIEWTAICAMVLAGGNFALYWQALRGRPLALWRSVELRAYIVLVATVAIAAVAWNASAASDATAIRRTIFGAVSISTTTGFTLVDYNQWAGSVQLLLLFAMVIGGMPGGSAGGFKTFRLLAMAGHVRRHLFSQLHPRAVPIVRIGDETITESTIARVLGYFALFMAVGGVATFGVAALGALDLRTSMSLVASALGNVGPALGTVSHHADVNSGARDVLMVTMLAGRLEIYPVLLGLVPLARMLSDRLPPRLAKLLIRAGRG